MWGTVYVLPACLLAFRIGCIFPASPACPAAWRLSPSTGTACTGGRGQGSTRTVRVRGQLPAAGILRRRRRRAAGLLFAGSAGCGILSAPGFPFFVSVLLSASLFRDIPGTAPVQGPHLCSHTLDISRALCTTHISSRPVSPPSPPSAFSRAWDRRAIGAAALRRGRMAPVIYCRSCS